MNGWSPATVTVDSNGDVVSVSVTEPRFTPYEKMLLLMARRQEHRDIRGPHGVLLSDAISPALQEKWEVEPAIDFVQKKLNAEQKAWREKYGDVIDLDAVLWSVKRAD